MVRLAGGRRSGIRELQSIMGSKEARAVTAADPNLLQGGEETGELVGPTKTGTEVTRTVRPGRSKDPEKQEGPPKETGSVSASDTAEFTATDKSFHPNSSFMSGLGDAVGQGASGQSDMTFGRAKSPTMKEWGVNPISMDEVMNNPEVFLELFDQKVGASPHMDSSDFSAYDKHSMLETLVDPSLGAQSFDRTVARAKNAQTPGANFMTMGDVMGWLETDGPGEAAIDKYSPDQLNGIMLASVQNNYPGMIVNSTKFMLDDAATRYQAAVATGYKGSYMDFLNDDGLADWLRGM